MQSILKNNFNCLKTMKNWDKISWGKYRKLYYTNKTDCDNYLKNYY